MNRKLTKEEEAAYRQLARAAKKLRLAQERAARDRQPQERKAVAHAK